MRATAPDKHAKGLSESVAEGKITMYIGYLSI